MLVEVCDALELRRAMMDSVALESGALTMIEMEGEESG